MASLIARKAYEAKATPIEGDDEGLEVAEFSEVLLKPGLECGTSWFSPGMFVPVRSEGAVKSPSCIPQS